MKHVIITFFLIIALTPVMALQTITKLQAGAFTSTTDITDPDIKLVDSNWTAAQFTALITATKGNLMLTSVDMSAINIISNNTLNATSMFEGCTNLKTVIMFTTAARLSGHTITKMFLNCTSLEGTIDMSAFPQYGSASYAFQNCTKLGVVKFSPTALYPTSTTYIFKDVNTNLKIYIPTSTSWDGWVVTFPAVTFLKYEPNNHVTGFSATVNSASQITISWTDAIGSQVPHGYLVKAAANPSNPAAPTDGTVQADATLVKNITSGTQTAVFTGLNPATTYNFTIWSYTNSGVNINYKTDGTVPTASGSTITPTYTWNQTGTADFSTASNWTPSRTTPTTADVLVFDNGATTTITNASTQTIGSINISNSTNLTLDCNTILTGNLNITSGQLTVNPTKQLTISGTFTNNGTLNLLSTSDGTATILTPSTIDGIGSYKVQQYLSSSRNWYISSPVTGALVPTGKTYYRYDETGNNSGFTAPASAYWVSEPQNTPLSSMVGYIAQPSSPSTIEFSGSGLNAGEKTILLTRTIGKTKEGFNLVGNPYPSHLSWLTSTATSANALSSIWYKTYNSGYVFQTYNANGDLGVPKEATGYIPPMQAFWVRVNSGGGTLTLNNNMCSHRTSNLLKSPAAKNMQQQVLRLEVSNSICNDETVLYFNSNAANGYDEYDSPKMFSDNVAIPEIYTMEGNEQLAINGKNSLILDSEIPLGFRTNSSNTFIIKATEIKNLDSKIKVILNDKLENTFQELKIGTDYSFISDPTSTLARFSVLFKVLDSTNEIANNTKINEQILVYSNANKQINIEYNGEIDENSFVIVYNSIGRKITSQKLTATKTTLERLNKTGVYLVVVNNLARKVIFK